MPQAQTVELFDNTDIPPRYRRYGVGDFSGVAQTLADFMAGQEWCIYLYGPTGSRKTTLACVLLAALRAKVGCAKAAEDKGIYLPIYQVVQQMRNVDSDTARANFERQKRTRWLLIDDLGKSRDTPHVVEQMLFLLHFRYDWADGTPKTIITANMDLKELADRIDAATARRIAEGVVLRLKMPQAQQWAEQKEK